MSKLCIQSPSLMASVKHVIVSFTGQMAQVFIVCQRTKDNAKHTLNHPFFSSPRRAWFRPQGRSSAGLRHLGKVGLGALFRAFLCPNGLG